MADELETELKHLIVDSLMLEDVEPKDIDSEAPLFVEGLGLDSIDALELAMAVHRKYGVRTSEDDERNPEIFYSVRSLAEFIRSEQAEGNDSGDSDEGAQPARAAGSDTA